MKFADSKNYWMEIILKNKVKCFLPLSVFRLLSSSLLLFPQCFGRYVRQTPEGHRIYRPKCYGNNNKDEDNSLKTLNDKNYQALSQKFRQLSKMLLFYLGEMGVISKFTKFIEWPLLIFFLKRLKCIFLRKYENSTYLVEWS